MDDSNIIIQNILHGLTNDSVANQALISNLTAHYEAVIDGYKKTIEDIKVEINQICDDNGFQRIHKDDVFKIIDKHIGERSE